MQSGLILTKFKAFRRVQNMEWLSKNKFIFISKDQFRLDKYFHSSSNSTLVVTIPYMS